MIESAADLRRVLGGTGAEVIEIDAPVASVHRSKFALWTEEDDAAYEAGGARHIWDVTHPDFDKPCPYLAVTVQTSTFETVKELRELLGGKKIFYYAYGTFIANHKPPTIRYTSDYTQWVPVNDGKNRLRYAIWVNE